MAVNFLNDISKYEFSGFPIGFSRNNPIPLDKTEVWLSLEELQTYAREGATAYVGQKLTHVDVENKTATVYVVANEDGDLMPVGSPTEGDEVSISLNDGVLSLKDFGKAFYRYIAAEGTEGEEGYVAAHYERTEVSSEYPWVAGLEPKVADVDGVLALAWYEPNPTTLEGLGSQVTTTQEAVEALETEVGELETEVSEVAGEVEEIQNVLNDTVNEEGETVEGLKTRVDNLETDVDNLEVALEDVYTKQEVDNLVSSVFHFKGAVDSYEELPLLNEVGDVYQIGDKEYAWNGTEWFELGDMVSLDGYATTDYADKAASDAAAAVQTNVDTLSGTVDTLSESVENLTTKVGELETANEATETALSGIDEKIVSLEAADTDFASRIGTLESYVGTPTGDLGALYPVVESLNSRLNDIVAEGGEPNQLNGISINGTALVPNEALIVDLPIFAGSTAGLVPVVDSSVVVETSFLSAQGTWIDVATLIDEAIDEALIWEAIES